MEGFRSSHPSPHLKRTEPFLIIHGDPEMTLLNKSRLPLLFLIAALIPMLLPDLAPYLELRMAAPADMSLLYRFFSGHFVHFSWTHFLYDAAVFLILGTLICRENEKELISLILFSSFAISLCVFICCRGLYSYRGLSGIDCALFGWLAMQLFPHRKWLVIPLLTGFCLKTAWEMTTGGAFFVGADVFEAVPPAHLAGCFCGIVMNLKTVERRGNFTVKYNFKRERPVRKNVMLFSFKSLSGFLPLPVFKAILKRQ